MPNGPTEQPTSAAGDDVRIKEIQVEKLFGIFDYRIPLNTAERITLIHGPNGGGKTTLLRFISDLAGQRFDALQSTRFQEFRLLFVDGAELRVARRTTRSRKDVAAERVTLRVSLREARTP